MAPDEVVSAFGSLVLECPLDAIRGVCAVDWLFTGFADDEGHFRKWRIVEDGMIGCRCHLPHGWNEERKPAITQLPGNEASERNHSNKLRSRCPVTRRTRFLTVVASVSTRQT